MTTRYLNIEAKHRQHFSMLASIADFTVSEGDTVDATAVLSNPNISLYCFDHAAKRAIFAELPDGVGLTSAPFVYLTQYEQAQRLVEMDYDTFRQSTLALPQIDNLIMIYSIGRSGSTLLSHLFNELDEVMSLSEPDVGVQFVHMRADGGVPDAELREMLDGSVRALFKPMPGKKTAIYALKPRSESMLALDLYQATFPNVTNLFLFRDAVGFIASFSRVLKADGFPDPLPVTLFLQIMGATNRQDWTPKLTYVAPDSEMLTLTQAMTLWWMGIIEWYLERYAQGIPMLAINYTDLNQKRDAILKAIFDYCGLPTDQIQKALSAYERDSQEGTIMARENANEGNTSKLSEAELAEIRRILAQHPVIKSPDYVVPGTPDLLD